MTLPLTSTNATDSGAVLRAARKARDLSQQALAEKAQCSLSYVRLLESGYRPDGDSDVLVRIAAALQDEGGDA